MMPESPDVPWFVPCLKTSRSKQENLENCIHWSTGKLHSLTLTFQDGCKEKRWSKVWPGNVCPRGEHKHDVFFIFYVPLSVSKYHLKCFIDNCETDISRRQAVIRRHLIWLLKCYNYSPLIKTNVIGSDRQAKHRWFRWWGRWWRRRLRRIR